MRVALGFLDVLLRELPFPLFTELSRRLILGSWYTVRRIVMR